MCTFFGVICFSELLAVPRESLNCSLYNDVFTSLNPYLSSQCRRPFGWPPYKVIRKREKQMCNEPKYIAFLTHCFDLQLEKNSFVSPCEQVRKWHLTSSAKVLWGINQYLQNQKLNRTKNNIHLLYRLIYVGKATSFPAYLAFDCVIDPMNSLESFEWHFFLIGCGKGFLGAITLNNCTRL